MSFWKKELLTQDVFGKCRDKLRYRKRHVIPELGFRGSTQEICSMLVCLTWKYNDSTNKRIKEILKTLSLPDKYVSIHVRRGDKIVESPYYSLERYFEKLGTKNKNLFVATDDYTVIEDIKRNILIGMFGHYVLLWKEDMFSLLRIKRVFRRKIGI